jgi:hypothetical protein
MHRAVSICIEQCSYKNNLKIWVNKTKTMAWKEKANVRSKIGLNNHTTEQVNSFKYLVYFSKK